MWNINQDDNIYLFNDIFCNFCQKFSICNVFNCEMDLFRDRCIKLSSHASNVENMTQKCIWSICYLSFSELTLLMINGSRPKVKNGIKICETDFVGCCNFSCKEKEMRKTFEDFPCVFRSDLNFELFIRISMKRTRNL